MTYPNSILRRRSLRAYIAAFISYLMLVGQVAPLALASNNYTARRTPAGTGQVQGLAAAPTAPAPLAPLATTVTATKTDNIPNATAVSPGDEISYEVTVGATGGDALNVQFSDTIDANTTLVGGSVTMSPLARNDSYSTPKDTVLNVNAAAGVLANDSGLPAPTAASVGGCADTTAPFAGCATTGGGTVTLNADGSFDYTPATGFEGSDTFTYTATNSNAPDDTATVTIVVDAAPTVTATTPTNGATGVANNTDITVTFSEPVTAPANAFTVSCATSGAHTVAVSGGPTTFTVNPSPDFANGEVCTVTVVAANVADTDTTDPPNNMAADFVFSFTVDNPPTVTATTPTNGATGVANNANISITFSEDVTAPASAFTISCATSGSHTFALSGGPTTFTLDPTTDFVANETCTVTVVAANVADNDTGDPPNNMAANFVFSFTTDAAPTVTTTTPANGATQVANNTDISITFSEPVNVTGSWFTISGASSGTHTATVTGGPTSFTLNPDADFTNGELVTVTVLAAQVTDQDSGDPPDNMAANFVFSFTIDQAPSVTTTTPANGATGVSANTNITVNFSESVNASNSSFTIECPAPGNTQAFTLSSSPSNSFTLNPNADLPVGVICTVTVVAANITDADAGDPPDNMAANFVFSFSIPPDAVDDSHAATGNIPFNASTTLIANDIGPSLTVTAIPGCADTTAPFDCATVRGGSVSVAANGAYSYNPPAGYEGADSITYTITNAAGSDTASINLSISGMLWFIDDSAAVCTANTVASNCGRLTNPFSTLAAFEAANGNATPLNNGHIIAPQAGEHIFLFAGSYTGPLTLENNQRLVGEGATASFAAISGVTPVADSVALPATGGTNPVITSSANGINLAQGNTLRGFTIGNTTGAKIAGNNFGTLTAGNSTSPDLLLNGTGQALNLTTGTFAVTSRFNSVTTTSSAAQGINLSAVAGTVNFGNTAVSGAAGTGVALAGVTAALTFADLDIAPNANQRGLHATTQTGALTTTSGTITTSGAAAIEIVGTSTASRAPLNLQLTTVNSTGGANGIVLTNTSQTGSPGGFTVLGTTAGNCGGVANPGGVSGTAPDTADCTGGQLQTATGANGANSGIGILLTDVEKVSLTRVRVNGHSNYGVKGTRVSGFTLSASYLHNNGDDVGGDGEGAVYFYELTGGSGANAITNSYLHLGAARNLHVLNTAGTLDRLTVSGTTIGNDGTSGSDGIFLQADNSANTGVAVTLRATVQNGRFLGSRGDGLQLSARGTSTTDLVFTGNRMTNNHPNQVSGSTAVTISAGGLAGSFNPTCTYNVSNNIINNNSANNGSGPAIAIGKGGISADASFVGTISGNQIGTAGVANSGSAQGSGIVVDILGGGVHNSTITNNTIRQFTNFGILAQSGSKAAGGGTGNLILDIRGNNIAEPSPASAAALFPTSGIRIVTGTTSGGAGTADDDDHNNCVTLGGLAAADKNSLANTGTNGEQDLRLFQRFLTQLAVTGYAGANNDNAAMNAFLTARNTVTSVDATNNTAAGGPGYTGTCTAPLSGPDTSDVRKKGAELMMEAEPSVDSSAPVAAPAMPEAAPAPARVWSDMPVIITRTPRSDSANDEKSDEDEDSAEEKEKEKDAATSNDAAPKKVRKPAKTKKPAEQTEQQPEAQPERRNISYLGPLGSAPARTPHFARASYEAGDAVVKSARSVPAKRTLKAAPVAAAPFAGETVNVTVGNMPDGKSVKIRFRVTVNNPFPVGTTQVSNQGTVTYTGGSVLTDDPDAGGAADPTVTLVATTAQIRINDAQAAEPASGTTDMTFTVVLASPATEAIGVNFETADGTATAGTCGSAGADYTTTTGTLNFAVGEQVKTINVPICADGVADDGETFLVNLSGETGDADIADGQATGTITAAAGAGTLIISELRTFGPGPGNDANDEFVEVYNNSDVPHTVTASDASAGYGLFVMGADCNAAPVLVGTIPNGTVIPARGHYLFTGSAYSLANYGGTGAAAGNLTLSSGIPANGNVGLFSTSSVVSVSSVNRLDAVGFGTNTGGVCNLLREGSTQTPATANLGDLGQYTYFRDMRQAVSGNPKDTNDNSADFLFADPNGANAGPAPRMGAAGPENLASPIRRDTSGIGLLLLDGSKAISAMPNRERAFTSDPGNNSPFGTLTIRRRVVNNTGGNVTRLRFRIVELTTFPAPPGTADLRARTSSVQVGIGPVGDSGTCVSSGQPAPPPPCNVTVQATTLETPPTQAGGGGFNSTLSAGTVTLGTPLANGGSLNVNFLLGIQQTGNFRFLLIIEALP